MNTIDVVPIIIAGTAMPATKAIPTGAPTKVPSCHNNFFFLDHGFLPQKVQPEGLYKKLDHCKLLNLVGNISEELTLNNGDH